VGSIAAPAIYIYIHKYCHVFEWLRREFGLVNRFIGSSLVITTTSCNTFKITVIITTKSSIHMLSLHRSSTNFLWLSPTRNWTELSLSLMLQPTVSRPVCLGLKHPSGSYDQIFIAVRKTEYIWQLRSWIHGRVCLLNVPLALASAVFLGS
jgi:hypothetical protein